MALAIAIFIVQNSDAGTVTMKFLLWQSQTSLIYTLLGSFGVGILFVLLFWLPKATKTSLQLRELKKQNENLEALLLRSAPGIPGEERQSDQ
jgi:uncharacterized integral membrane protein